MRYIGLLCVVVLLVLSCAAPYASDSTLDTAVAEVARSRGEPDSITVANDMAVLYWPQDTVVLRHQNGEWTECVDCMVVILTVHPEVERSIDG